MNGPTGRPTRKKQLHRLGHGEAVRAMHYPDGVSDVTDPRGDLEWGTLPGLVQDAAARFGEAEALVDLGAVA